MADKEKIKLSELVFGLHRKKGKSSFSNSKDLLSLLNKRSAGSTTDLSTFDSARKLDPYFRSPESNLKGAIEISNTLYTTNKVYAAILDYLADMYYWRYRALPRLIKEGGTSDYDEIYREMLEVVDGANIETVFPKILLNILKDGECYVTAVKNTTTKTVSTIILPNIYCKKTTLTQHNTNEIMFDMKFFDDLGLKGEELEKAFQIFPKEFKRAYDFWKSDRQNSSFQPLDSRTSTCFSLNDTGFPTYLSLFYDIIDHKTYKLNELDRNSAQLDTLVVQELDLKNLAEAGIVVDEIQDLHENMAEIADNGRGSRLLTSLGKIKVEQMQGKESIENKTLRNMLLSVFENAGINSNLFFGETRESLEYSLKRDLSYVWGLVEKLVIFYNLAINNLYNFREYQLSLTLLPISPYNESEKLLQYRQNATLGVGILDYIIASGVKQIDLDAMLELDSKLDLNSRLKPLQSSHTQSSGDVGGAPKREEREPEEKDIKVENEE